MRSATPCAIRFKISLFYLLRTVLDAKHISHRARHAHSAHGKPKRGFALPYHDEDEEAEWRRSVVQTLEDVHAKTINGTVEIEVRSSEVSVRHFESRFAQ